MKFKSAPMTLYPIDIAALSTVVVLTVLAGILLLSGVICRGDRCWVDTRPKVAAFNWQDEIIRAEDNAFVLEFNRPMDHDGVENNLKITIPDKPEITNPLPGKVSWAGRRLAYTLDFPAPYGDRYQLSLAEAQEKFRGNDELGQEMQPFTATFRTPDRIFAYIGLEREEEGRLILYNLTQQRKTILTPPNLVITEFEPYPDGQSILFTAIDADLTRTDLLEQQLYRVTTGISATPDAEPTAAGQVTPQLTNETHQILNFDLSADGSIIVVQRVERDDPTQMGLWLIRDDQDPVPLENQPGGVFQIAPDNQLIAMAQGEGIALLSLEPGAEPLDFFAQFGMVLDFAPDGTTAAMVDYNRDKPDLLYTRSLYLVTNQRSQEKVFDTRGSIVDCDFDPRGENLYCLLTNLLEGQEYAEQPYVAQVNLETKEILPLTTLPNYQDIHLSVAPDGLALLFDQLTTDPDAGRDRRLQTDGGEAIVNSQLWILIPPADPEDPPALEELPFVGIQPQWLP
ncbi:hypothetical protein PN441_09905 [Spirulina major CS-329]|uniref:hypothetical protein n=2 Tax=Spirulinaceae TaxID=1890448 RepID=UPI002330A8DE|nr:hypothetical protein [Spirulina major]MDB9503385.1 hypothetical protein [Spirulina major CS-329]